MFVADLSIPSSLNFSAKPGDTVYVFTYTKDAEGVISMSWTNRLGQLVQTAHEVKAVGADMKNWEWAMKRYEYDRRGLLSRTVTPLDVKNNNFDFAIVNNFVKCVFFQIFHESPDHNNHNNNVFFMLPIFSIKSFSKLKKIVENVYV